MGLFINRFEHPGVYKNEEDIREPNQGYLKIDYFGEMRKKQERINHSLVHAYYDLKMRCHMQEDKQTKQWGEISNQLKGLHENDTQHLKITGDTIAWQNRLEKKVMKLNEILETESGLKQEILHELNNRETSNKGLATQIGVVHDLQKQMAEQTGKQEEIQQNVLERLEEQEALMEKITRQIEHFRSILFERTNHLVEKIESSYDLTSTFFYKMLTGSDQPLTLMMMKEKKEESERKSSH